MARRTRLRVSAPALPAKSHHSTRSRLSTATVVQQPTCDSCTFPRRTHGTRALPPVSPSCRSSGRRGARESGPWRLARSDRDQEADPVTRMRGEFQILPGLGSVEGPRGTGGPNRVRHVCPEGATGVVSFPRTVPNPYRIRPGWIPLGPREARVAERTVRKRRGRMAGTSSCPRGVGRGTAPRGGGWSFIPANERT